MKKLNFLILFVLCLSIQFSFAQNKLQLKPGSKYERVVNTDAVTIMSMMGQEMEMSQKAKTKVEVEITKEESKYFEFTTKLLSISSEVSQMGQDMSFDSENEEDMNGPLAEIYQAVLGTTNTMHISKDGNSVDSKTEDSDEDYGNIQEALSMFIALPENVKTGDTWTAEQDFDQEGILLKSKKDYKVKSIERNLVTLEVKGDMSINQNAVNQGVEVKTKIKGNVSGEIIVDKTNNIVTSENSFSSMEGNTHTSGMDIPIKVRTTTKVATKKL